MKVFWSWQSDTPANLNKEFVKEALTQALEQVSDDLGFTEAERPEVDHDTKGAPGLVAIVEEIFKKIEQATVFVGDVTYVGKTEKGRLLPNPNVLIELGHALTSVGYEGIILVANSAFGGAVEDLPFDLRHRRGPITYKLPAGATPEQRAKALQKLTEALVVALTSNLGAAIVKRDADVTFDLHPSRPGDRSTWLKEEEKLRHTDAGWSSREREWVVPELPRAYMRLIPASWKTKPNRHQVSNANDNVRLWAFGPSNQGDYGPNDHGVVSVGFLGTDSNEAIGATQWFNDTGEIWGFTNAATYPHPSGRRGISSPTIAKEWDKFLRKGLHFLEHFGATGPIRVEAGVSGLDNTYWINEPWGSTRGLEKEIYLERSHRAWTPEERRAFMTDLYNKLLDAYGLAHVGPESVPFSP
jgi:hypothetical protein